MIRLLSAVALVVASSYSMSAHDEGAVARVVDLSRSLPPEFKADVLLRLAEAGVLGSSRAAGDALEDAFFAAFGAQERVRLETALPTGRTTGREGARSLALANHLDQVTLETRALRALAAVDLGRARALEPFVRVDVPPLECRDALVYNVDAAYRNLTAFASALPDPDRFLFVQRYVRGIRSSLQVAPAADMLARLSIATDERAALVAAFASELEHLDDDDRAFMGALLQDRVVERVYQLGAALRKQDRDPGALVEAFRTFLVRHFRNRRCADSVVGPDVLATQWFNDDVRPLTMFDVAPIEYDEHGGRWLGASAEYHHDEPGPDWRALWWEIGLTLGSGGGRFATVAAYAPYLKTPEGVVGDVLVWHGSGAPAAQFFHHKAALLQGLLEFLPPRSFRPLHDIVLAELVTFLAATGQSADDRAAWFLHVNNLLDYARRANKGDRETILRAFAGSNNLVMNGYAALEQIAPKRVVRW